MDDAGIDEPMDFAGSSLGSAAALHGAIAAPHRFRRLVLIIPPVAWETGPAPAGGERPSTRSRIRAGRQSSAPRNTR